MRQVELQSVLGVEVGSEIESTVSSSEQSRDILSLSSYAAETFSADAIARELVGQLDDRAQDILVSRFNLDGKGVRTLESIGQRYGITRERVRQVEAATLRKLRTPQSFARLRAAKQSLQHVLGLFGGVAEQDFLVSRALPREHRSAADRAALIFFLALLPDFTFIRETLTVRAGWANKDAEAKMSKEVGALARGVLKASGKPLSSEVLADRVLALWRAEFPTAVNQHERSVLSYVMLDKKIDRNPFGEWGLVTWKEIVPKGVRDKAYLVLRKVEQPLHFQELTAKINEAGFDSKTAYAQTVHNELIKDDRFVLVGRGMYALRAWGYESGTVADIAERALRAHDGKMNVDELVEEVLKQRFVKRNTVLLALQNKERFSRVDRKTYALVG